MRTLILGDVERARIAELIERARTSAVPYATMKAMAQAYERGRKDLGRENAALTISLPVGYTATYTHEEHKPGVMCRHLSVGGAAMGSAPHPQAVEMLLEAFGFVNRVGGLATWLERLDDGSSAVNCVEPVSGNMQDVAR